MDQLTWELQKFHFSGLSIDLLNSKKIGSQFFSVLNVFKVFVASSSPLSGLISLKNYTVLVLYTIKHSFLSFINLVEITRHSTSLEKLNRRVYSKSSRNSILESFSSQLLPDVRIDSKILRFPSLFVHCCVEFWWDRSQTSSFKALEFISYSTEVNNNRLKVIWAVRKVKTKWISRK